MPNACRPAVIAVLLAMATASPAEEPAPHPLASLPLTRAFATRTPWRLDVRQEARTPADVTPEGEAEPGRILPCLHRDGNGDCSAAVDALLTHSRDYGYAEPHFLNAARVVHQGPHDRAPLLLLVMASVHSGDGGQLVLTQLLKYRPAKDDFARVFRFATGTNNNQDARFVETGPIRGYVVTAEPTGNAPFGYWITVYAHTLDGPYHSILRYRSATHYNDGNSLPVIDSEMPQILHRLGRWKTGRSLPLPPNNPCPAPQLKAGALWCA